mgnify:CR=1 FL=1
MAYQSLLGYAKDGLAEVVAKSNSIMNTIDTWALQAYRNLKFYSPTTGDLNTWLQSNAVKMPLEGTWVFNNTLTNVQFAFTGDFISNGTNYTTINFSAGYFKYDQTEVYQHASTMDSGWSNAAYRTITFTSPVKYEGNEEFIRWFVDNAAQSGGVSFKLNDTITMSIRPENVTWTSDRIAKVPSYYCTPYFINNFKIGDKSYTYFGAHKDATIFKSYRQMNGATTYDTTAGLTIYLNILPDESFYA